MDMKGHNIQLTAPEIASLWTTYLQNSSIVCFYIHFLQHLNDIEIKAIVEEALGLSNAYIKKIEALFIEEAFPIPKGFSDKDVDFSAPLLYSELFALSFVYRVGQMAVPNYGTILTKVARTDVVNFFDESLKSSTELYKRSLHVMLSKGIYDRPPKIPYPNNIEYMKKQQSLLSMWFGEKRPLNTLELGEIFYTIERNYIGILLLMGLIQVTKDREIKEYLIRGKKLSEKHIDIFNKVLRDEEHLGTIPVSIEVTNSTISPFSDRLILFLITATTGAGVNLLAFAMANSMRKDLVAHYSLLIPEIMMYGGEGLDIMIKRGWMEQPPLSSNRNDLYKS
jgi:hypothetical protein